MVCGRLKLCEEVITIINQRYDQEEGFTVYRKTIVRGASWYGSLKSTVDPSGLKAANQYTVRIPIDADFGGKTYVNPVTYKGASDEQSGISFTPLALHITDVGPLYERGLPETSVSIQPASLAISAAAA